MSARGGGWGGKMSAREGERLWGRKVSVKGDDGEWKEGECQGVRGKVSAKGGKEVPSGAKEGQWIDNGVGGRD